ncbi:MAG: hypothetical protein HYV13_03375 [Candidatus Doudnabacteria bacterium]|nr:hypothetical protein [Candidatus Doudnabacteria bacterium]
MKNRIISKLTLALTLAIAAGFAFANFASAAPPQVSISATPSLLKPGDSTTITWSASAGAVQVDINSSGAFRRANAGVSGSATDTPTTSTAYTIYATNQAGERSQASFTVRVDTSGTPQPSPTPAPGLPPITVTGCYNEQNLIQGNPPLNEDQCRRLAASGAKVRWEVVGTAPTILISKQSFEAAQTNAAACRKFKDDLWNATGRYWKALWWQGAALGLGTKAGCYIYHGNANDPGNAGTTTEDPSNRPITAINFERLIRESESGITNEQFTAYTTALLEDKKNAAGLSKVFGWVIYFITNVLNSLIATLTTIAGGIMAAVIKSTTSFTDMPEIVKTGWVIMRDIMNMFFVLAMIVISLATILNLESYNYKKLLTKLVIMALLINFSQAIAVALINVSNMLVNVFAIDGSLSTIFANLIGITADWSMPTMGWEQALVIGISQLVLNAVMLIAFLALAALFVVRMVGLYVLVIFSPIAYALYILPETSQYAKQWWTTFIKYLIWAPVAMFMVWLTIFITKPQGLGINQDVIDTTAGGDSYFKFVILTAFMFAAVYVAKQAGMVGSEAILSMADKAMKGVAAAPFVGAWAGSKALANLGAEKLLESRNIEIRPRKWIEGWKESREANRLAREEAGLAKAEGKSVLANPTSFFQRYMFGRGGIKKALLGQNRQGKKLLDDVAANEKRANELEQEGKLAAESALNDPRVKAMQAEYERKKALGITDNYLKSQVEAAQEKASAPYMEEAERLRAKAAKDAEEARHLVHEPDYFTQRKLREATNHEKAKITGEVWQEMFDQAQGAVGEKHIARFKALFEKLADTYNENELITHWKYTRDMNAKETGAWKDVKTRDLLKQRYLKTKKDVDGKDISEVDIENGNFKMHKLGELFHEDKSGIENFRKLILEEKLGMSEAASMRHLADIGDIAQKRGHVGIWRLYNTKNGRWQMNPYDEWDAEMRVEKGKMQESEYMSTNRLFGHDEYTASNGARISIAQENELDMAMNFIDAINFRLGRGTFDLSKARALAFAPNVKRLRHRAADLNDTDKVDPKGIGNQQITVGTKYKDINGVEKTISQNDLNNWTRKKQVLYTVSQLERIGLSQFKGEERKAHEAALKELLEKNRIEERYRTKMRESGMTEFKSEFEPAGAESVKI